MSPILVGICFSSLGIVLFGLSFLWEVDFLKRATHKKVDRAFERQGAKRLEEPRQLQSFNWERNAIDWTRAAGALGLLVGILVAMWLG